jgi:predicted Ser/Thr protein kinase
LNFPKSSTSGKGAFGIVYESEWDGIKIAIKVLNLISSYNTLGAEKSVIS